MNRNLQRVLFAGAGCALVVVVGLVVLVIFLGVLVQEPEGVRVSVGAPAEATVGEPFLARLQVENISAEPRTLVDLDVADSYLEGFIIQSSSPPYTDTLHVPLDNTLSHSYDLPVPPGGSLVVLLTVMPVRTGDHYGDFDFCIDSELSCISQRVRTVVRAGEAGL